VGQIQQVSPLVSIALVAWTSALLGLPEDLVNLQGPRAFAGRRDAPAQRARSVNDPGM